jgi:hypothetical protein
LKNDWLDFGPVIAYYQKHFPGGGFKDYAWAMQFVTTRCFGWYLPHTMLVPMVDCVNHDHREICTTEIMNLRLEKESDPRALALVDYRKLGNKYDLQQVYPEQRYEASKKRGNLVHF